MPDLLVGTFAMRWTDLPTLARFRLPWPAAVRLGLMKRVRTGEEGS
jgi:hypothetical protein